MAEKASEQHPEYLQVLSAVAAAVGGGQGHENNPGRIVQLSDSSLVISGQVNDASHTAVFHDVGIIGNAQNPSALSDTEIANQQIEIASGGTDILVGVPGRDGCDHNAEETSAGVYDGSTESTQGVSEEKTPMELEVKFLSDITDLVIKEIPCDGTSHSLESQASVTYWVCRQNETIQSENVSIIKEESTGITFQTNLDNFQVKQFHADGCIVYLITNQSPDQHSLPDEPLMVHEVILEKSTETHKDKKDNTALDYSSFVSKQKRNGLLDKAITGKNNKKSKTGHHMVRDLSTDLKKPLKSGSSLESTNFSDRKGGQVEDKPVLVIGRLGRVRKLRPELVHFMKRAKTELETSSLSESDQRNTAADSTRSGNDVPTEKSQSPVKRKRGRPRKVVVDAEVLNDNPPAQSDAQVQLFTEKKRGRGRPRKDEVEYDPDIFVVGKPRQPGRPRKIGQHLNERRLAHIDTPLSASSASVRRPGRPRKTPVSIETVNQETKDLQDGNEETADAVADVGDKRPGDTEPTSTLEGSQKQSVWVDRAGNVLQSVKHYFDLAVARTKRTFCADCLTNMHGNIRDSRKCPFYNPKHTVTNPEEGMTNVNIQSLTSLPSGLCLIKNQKTNKMAVYAFEQLKPLSQYGPLVGILLTEDTFPEGVDLEDIWFLRYEEQGERHFLYCGEPENSNWCRFLQESAAEEANMLAVMKPEGIFFVTTRTISPMEALKVHVPYYGNKERPFVHGLDIPECPRCEVQFRDMIGFQKHFHIYHPYGLKNKKLACSECGCVFHNRKVLRTHSKEVHGGKGGIDCPQCERVFFYESQLAHHMKTKHPDPSAALECPKCSKVFKSEAALRSHLQRTHSSTTYSCPTCSKTFPHKSSMNKHQRHIHEKQYKFVCTICDRGFPDTWALKNHVASHNKNKIYVCQTCHISFSSRYLVRQHLVSVHGLEKVALPSDPPDSEEVEVLYEQVLEDQRELTGQVVELIAEGETEGEVVTENLGIEGREISVETVELVEKDGQQIFMGDNQHFVIEEGNEQVKVLAADDVALQYTIEIEGGEQWTV